MNWKAVISPVRNWLARSSTEPAAVLEQPQVLTARSIERMVAGLNSEKTAQKSIACLAAALLVAPESARWTPLEILDICSRKNNLRNLWQSLALLMLHTHKRSEASAYLTRKWREQTSGFEDSFLLSYMSDWFPEELSKSLPESVNDLSLDNAPLVVAVERQLFRKGQTVYHKPESLCDIGSLFVRSARLLVVHNIVDGLGDELVRTNALLQAFIDGLPSLKVTIFTNRPFLYDHPRVTAFSIADTDAFRRELAKQWGGLVNFFEPYLPSNSYNLEIQDALSSYLELYEPPICIRARKSINHFVYESVVINGTDKACKWQLRQRRLPLNYETTMRLIVKLGLPLRTGEMTATGGWLPVAQPAPEIVKSWQRLKREMHSCGRPIALVNIFGGQNPMKGFQSSNFPQLKEMLERLIDEGFNVILTPNGTEWGSAHEIDALLDNLPARLRLHTFPAPLSDARNPQEKMRIIKHCVAWSDLVVTVEGWMMHMAYALGKPYRLLMAPYSYPSEWHPHGRSTAQGLWAGYAERPFRSELSIPAQPAEGMTPPLLHHPEKGLLKAALDIWGETGDLELGRRLLYWLGSRDKDIRSWVISALGKIDPLAFQSELLQALEDCNREVRASAAIALLKGGHDLSDALGLDWQNSLRAYQLIGEFRFQELRPLGYAAFRALRACLNQDESEVNRDAAIMLESMKLNTITTLPHGADSDNLPRILILTPIKDSAHEAEGYFARLKSLDYPQALLSIGLLESDSQDNSYAIFKQLCEENRRFFRAAQIWKRDFSYKIPSGVPRWEPSIQFQRRSVLARSRNHLLFHALDDEDWVLWLDVDVIEFPPDIIQRLLSYDKDIVQPHCVKKYCGPTFDLNAWRNRGRLFMHDLRPEGEITPLDAVGGTMLLIRADCHRDGLIFPPFLYGKRNEKVRPRDDISMPGEEGEVETEGLGIMASDMQFQCWALPHLEIIHADR